MILVEEVLKETASGEKEIDFYVPIRVEFEKNDDKSSALYYYRLINEHSSFIELAINATSKKIVSITLISINDITEYDNSLSNRKRLDSQLFGNPTINLDIFKKERIVTEKKDFSVMYNNENIFIIQDKVNITGVIVMQNVKLLMDNNRIVGFIFSDFAPDEWKEIQESVLNTTGKVMIK